MKRKTSLPNDEVMIAEIRDNPVFAASYLAAAIEEADEPGVLLDPPSPNRGSLWWHGQGCQGRRDTKGKSVSGIVQTRQSATDHIAGCYTGLGNDLDGRQNRASVKSQCRAWLN